MLEADCRAYGIMLASGENTMASRAGAFVVGPSTLPGTPFSAGIHSGPVVRVGEFTHPAKQKTIRSTHPIDDFAKNWLFKQIGVTLI